MLLLLFFLKAALKITSLMKSDLAANAKMGVGDKLWLLMAVVLLLQECVQHANSNTWKGNHEGEDLPGLTWG